MDTFAVSVQGRPFISILSSKKYFATTLCTAIVVVVVVDDHGENLENVNHYYNEANNFNMLPLYFQFIIR